MLKFCFNQLKVIAKHLVIAFLLTSSFIFILFLFFGRRIDAKVSLINKVFVFNDTYIKRDKDISIDNVSKKLKEYPNYGDAYGSVNIPSINVDVALYHGEALRILKYGLGHHAGSYFPGEGGTIIIAGHNTYGQLYSLPKININDSIIIKTDYGKYTYKVNKTNIMTIDELNSNFKLNKDRESLILYTCYPVETPGYKSKRFVVFANLEGD